MSYQAPLGYFPISSSAPRPLEAAYIPILLSEVEQEQRRVGGSRSKERDRKSELVLRSTYQIFEWDRNFYHVVRYVHIPIVP